MGLRIDPGGAEWSYHGFARFRELLAAADDIDLREMQGFGGVMPWDDTHTSLKPLLNHSDCDGFIDGIDCRDMLPRLREIQTRWEAADPALGLDYDIKQLRALIAGMEHCAEHYCAMAFS